MHEITISYEDILKPYVKDALARLGYIFPELDLVSSGSGIRVRSSNPFDELALKKEIRYALYRSKIRAEGAQNRAALYSSVFGK
ncbi:hypothetical protein SAMN05444000_1459 [Shimia gijangensis]|uniref:Uncharacterized protein n=1 Tax=Shimia gijangensis TaxID=1470563 RepID=A0A1M6TUC6_9RHOB|nr:hypothetical protein SAMN05444000_1459 [Shimia gijangensis]